MITEHKCDKIKETPWKDKIRECCDKEDPDDPKGCDCCYDTWTEELKEVKTRFSEADEEAKYVTMELAYIAERRDRLKNWYDELTKADDLSREICDQVEIFLDQIHKVHINTVYATKAIRVLYCMTRDFYMQIDLIKTKYDLIINCIRCLNDPVLAPGQGIMKCLEDYGKKLEILIATRNELVKMVMGAIYSACRINENLDQDYGLYMMIEEWKKTLNCDEKCGEGSSANNQNKAQGSAGIKDSNGGNYNKEDANCNLSPMLKFPVCNDPYYDQIKCQFEDDKARANELAVTLIDLNKKKESLLSCKQSLEAAIKEVDPKTRC